MGGDGMIGGCIMGGDGMLIDGLPLIPTKILIHRTQYLRTKTEQCNILWR